MNVEFQKSNVRVIVDMNEIFKISVPLNLRYNGFTCLSCHHSEYYTNFRY